MSATRIVGPGARFGAALVTWALLFGATPGVVTRDGSLAVAALALAPWAVVCSRPGKRAFWIEWLAAAIGLSAACFWSTYVLWITLLAVALVPAVYMAVAGVVLRGLARRIPLALAVPAAWIGLETLRALVEPPFGFGWMRLGHHAHADPWLAGSARVWGTGGIGFALAAVAGGIADLVRARLDGHPSRLGRTLALGLGPLALGAILSWSTTAPASVDGPRVMLVQPAFPQERKMRPPSREALLRELIDLTRRGLADARAAREPEPDLVAWGETMLPVGLVAPDLLAAWRAGARTVPWARDPLSEREIEAALRNEAEIVGGVLLGVAASAGVLPRGTSFLSGVEHYADVAGAIRRQNAVALWNANGQRTGTGGKVHLVPGAETLCGLERLAWVRDTARELAGYVPDLIAFERTAVLPLTARDGRTFQMGTSVCFDNAYDGPYTEPVRRGPLDFHLIVSNEAWYRESFEYDQMMAFSHLLAIATGRSVVRATNAGITAVIGPDGRDLARLAVDGRDRMVAGTLRATVPVPATGAPGARAPRPIFAASEWLWLATWLGLPVGLWIFARRAPVTARA